MRGLALLVITLMVAPGCAATRPLPAQPLPRTDPDLMRDYVKQLPIGAVVLARLTAGGALRGILMKVSDDTVTVQPQVRIPEPPVVIRLEDIVTIELDQARQQRGQQAWLALVPLGIILLVTALTSGAT